MLGHLEKDCRKKEDKAKDSKRTLVLRTLNERKMAKGYVECFINKKYQTAYVDPGSKVTLIKKTVAEKFKLKIQQCQPVALQRYGRQNLSTVHESTTAMIQFDDYKTELKMLVAPDDIQEEPLKLGQDLLYREDLVITVQNGEWCFLKAMTKSPKEIDPLDQKQIVLRARSKTTIPPRSVGFCKIQCECANIEPRTIFVEGQSRGRKGEEHLLIPCVTSTQGRVCIKNLSSKPVTYNIRQVIARAEPCKLDQWEYDGEGKRFELQDLENVVSPEQKKIEEIS